ncbi:MAG: RNase adapter RapZ [Vicinamibacterales bacterium]
MRPEISSAPQPNVREPTMASKRATGAQAFISPASRFVVLTGLSGSGKSQAIRALEDLGYFCVDNLPTTLIPTFAELTLRAHADIAKAAVVVDVREGSFLAEFPRVYGRLKRLAGLKPTLIFLDASEAALVRRFSETRRPHPLASSRSVVEGIHEERAKLDRIRRMADVVIDTSDMTVHELRRAFQSLSAEGPVRPGGPIVTLLSFGFKYGLPLDADIVLDVRFLPNPHFVASLRRFSGKDAPVKKFLRNIPDTAAFLAHATELLRFLIPRFAAEGKSYVTIGIGCTGGRHRSVYMAEAIRAALKDVAGVRLRTKHRDIAND